MSASVDDSKSDAALLRDDGAAVALDERGHLLDSGDWSEALAREMARRDGIELVPEHFAVLRYLREYHAEFRLFPPMRLLVKDFARHSGASHADSRYLYRLFPQGPAKQASRYAGLPRPASCI